MSCKAGAVKVFTIDDVGIVGKKYRVKHTLPYVMAQGEYEPTEMKPF